MNKQTNAEHTLGRRSKGKYKGDEDKLKSSTDKPRKELVFNLKIIYVDYTNRIEDYEITTNGNNTFYFYIKKIKE